MANITMKQMDDSFYRSGLLRDKLDELEGILSGRRAGLDIAGEDGKTDPKKLDALINALIESLRHYLALKGRELEDWEENMYSRFLYCAMQMMRKTANKRNPSVTFPKITNTFEDIINTARDVCTGESEKYGYRDFLKMFVQYYEDIIMDAFEGRFDNEDTYKKYVKKMSKFCKNAIYYTHFLAFGFFESIPRETRLELYMENNAGNKHAANPKNIAYILADDPGRFFFEYGQEIDLQLSRHMGMHDPDSEMTLDEANRLREKQEKIISALKSAGENGSYENNEVLSKLSPEDIAKYQSMLDNNTKQNTWSLWQDSVADMDLLQKRFWEFIELYYSNDHSDFLNNVIHMVEAYLIENNLTVMPFDDQYGLVMYQVNRAIGRIISEKERVKDR